MYTCVIYVYGSVCDIGARADLSGAYLLCVAKNVNISDSRGPAPQLNFQCHFIPRSPCSSSLSLQICCSGERYLFFNMSGKIGNRSWSGESEEGELGWSVVGPGFWFRRKATLRDRRHLATMQPRRPGSCEREGKEPAFGEGS